MEKRPAHEGRDTPNEGIYFPDYDRDTGQIRDRRRGNADSAEQRSFDFGAAPTVSDQRNQLTDNFNALYPRAANGKVWANGKKETNVKEATHIYSATDIASA